MLGLLLAVSLASPSPPAATITGFSPVLRFDGVQHDAVVLAPSAEEVTVAPRWSWDDGVHVSLDGGGERADTTLPGCGHAGCIRRRDGTLLVVEPGGIRHEQAPRWSSSGSYRRDLVTHTVLEDE